MCRTVGYVRSGRWPAMPAARRAAVPHYDLSNPLGPIFAPRMSLADVYHYATLHFEHHRRQLTLTDR